MRDARELSLDFGRRNHLAVRKMAEVELHAGTETPVERHLVDGDRPLPAVHCGMEVVGGVEMGAVVRRDLEALQGPALTARQVLDLQAREKGSHARGGGTMVHVFDLGQMARRIGGDVRLQRDGEINDASWHLGPLTLNLAPRRAPTRPDWLPQDPSTWSICAGLRPRICQA